VRGFKPGAKAYRIDIPRALFEKYKRTRFPTSDKPLPKGKALAQSVPLSLIVAYDGVKTWVGMSPDEATLIKRLESLKDPKQPVLRARAGLEALKGTPHAAGGFVSLARFGSQLGAFGASDEDASKLMSALPHHGETPLLYTSDVSASGPQLTTAFRIPRAAVEDLGALVPVLALMAGKHDSVSATP
jgi:hypothetical protein